MHIEFIFLATFTRDIKNSNFNPPCMNLMQKDYLLKKIEIVVKNDLFLQCGSIQENIESVLYIAIDGKNIQE